MTSFIPSWPKPPPAGATTSPMPKYASTMPYAPAQSISPDDRMSSTARLSHERPHTGSVTAPSPSVASYG